MAHMKCRAVSRSLILLDVHMIYYPVCRKKKSRYPVKKNLVCSMIRNSAECVPLTYSRQVFSLTQLLIGLCCFRKQKPSFLTTNNRFHHLVLTKEQKIIELVCSNLSKCRLSILCRNVSFKTQRFSVRCSAFAQ